MDRLLSIILASPALLLSVTCFSLASTEAGVELYKSYLMMNTPAPQAAPNGQFRGADGQDEYTIRSGGSSNARGRNGLNSHRRDDSPELREDTQRSGMPSSPKVLRYMFLKAILIGLVCRLIMLPVQAYFYSADASGDFPYMDKKSGLCNVSSQGCMVSRTLPDLAFANAFSVLIVFYARMTIEVGRKYSLENLCYHPNGLTIVKTSICVSYAVFLFLTTILPIAQFAQRAIWGFLSLVYFLLFILSAYFGSVLPSILGPSVPYSLSFRLVGACVVSSVILMGRSLTFGLEAWKGEQGYIPQILHIDENSAWNDNFARDALEALLFELLPSVIVIFFIRERPKSTSNEEHANSSSVPNGYSGDSRLESGALHSQYNMKSGPEDHKLIGILPTLGRKSVSVNGGIPLGHGRNDMRQHQRGVVPVPAMIRAHSGRAGAETSPLLDRSAHEGSYGGTLRPMSVPEE